MPSSTLEGNATNILASMAGGHLHLLANINVYRDASDYRKVKAKVVFIWAEKRQLACIFIRLKYFPHPAFASG